MNGARRLPWTSGTDTAAGAFSIKADYFDSSSLLTLDDDSAAVLDDHNVRRIKGQLLIAPGGPPMGSVLRQTAAGGQMGKASNCSGWAIGADTGNEEVLMAQQKLLP